MKHSELNMFVMFIVGFPYPMFRQLNTFNVKPQWKDMIGLLSVNSKQLGYDCGRVNSKL